MQRKTTVIAAASPTTATLVVGDCIGIDAAAAAAGSKYVLKEPDGFFVVVLCYRCWCRRCRNRCLKWISPNPIELNVVPKWAKVASAVAPIITSGPSIPPAIDEPTDKTRSDQFYP